MSKAGMEPMTNEEKKSPVMAALDNLWDNVAELGDQLKYMEQRLEIALDPVIHDVEDKNAQGRHVENEEQTSILTNKINVINGEVQWMRDKVAFIDKYLEL